MSKHSQLFYGTASEVADLLYFCDPETLNKSELIAALINAFNRIDRLEKQITKIPVNKP